MPITQLDTHTALIVVDLQKGIVRYELAHPAGDVIKKSVALITAFRQHRLPVVLVNVAGGAPGRTDNPRNSGPSAADHAELVPELGAQPDDHYVTKKSWGAFAATDLADYLKQKKITQVVIVGIATSIGVESTAREAHALGFNVTLVSDAMTDLRADTHENSISRIFPRLGEVDTAQAVIAKLDARG